MSNRFKDYYSRLMPVPVAALMYMLWSTTGAGMGMGGWILGVWDVGVDVINGGRLSVSFNPALLLIIKGSESKTKNNYN